MMERLTGVVVWSLVALGLYSLAALAVGVWLPSSSVIWVLRGSLAGIGVLVILAGLRRSLGAVGLKAFVRRVAGMLTRPVGGQDQGGQP